MSKFSPPPLPSPEKGPSDNRDWFTLLMRSLEDIVQDLLSILVHGITIADNVAGGYAEIDVIGGIYPITFSVKTPRVSSVQVAWIKPFEADGTLTGGVTPLWEHKGQLVKISLLTGLTADKKYRIRFLYLE